jgi:preprotein translocase subunit Sec63
MGAQGSRPSENKSRETSKVPDYYEILGVEDSATADEIKVRVINISGQAATDSTRKVESIPQISHPTSSR